MTTRLVYKGRSYAGEQDLQPSVDLLNLIDAKENLDDNYSVADLALEFSEPEFNVARDLRLWENEQGRLVGFGQLWMPSTSKEVLDGHFYFRVHPDYYNSGIEDEMFAWCEGRLREASQERGIPAEMRAFGRQHYQYMMDQIAGRGFEVVRYFFRMARPLSDPIPAPQFPEGFTVRHSEGEADIEPWVEMFNQSFIDHYNHHDLTVESHKHWLAAEKYKAERDLIAVAPDGTFAAFCFCVIDTEANERNNRKESWIDILGTRRGYRKIGLGRAMLLLGMQKLKDDGMDTAMLGVDAENPSGALKLYESVGFVTMMTSVVYVKKLA